MTTPEPKTVREIARQHIRSGRTDIGTTVALHFGRGALSYEEFAAWEYDVHKAWRVELRAVSWPDEQQPADVVTAEQQQDGAVGHEAFDTIRDWVDGARFDEELIELEAQTLRTALADYDALAARVAELGEAEVEQRMVSPSGLVDEPTLRDLENQAYWLPGVRLEERQVYPTPWRVAADALQDGRSGPVERSETSGGIGTASNSSAGAAGLSGRRPAAARRSATDATAATATSRTRRGNPTTTPRRTDDERVDLQAQPRVRVRAGPHQPLRKARAAR